MSWEQIVEISEKSTIVTGLPAGIMWTIILIKTIRANVPPLMDWALGFADKLPDVLRKWDNYKRGKNEDI